jgi:YfiH family protein
VVDVRRGLAQPRARAEADVLVSDNPEIAVAVRAADCVPLLIADSRTGAVAAVHAGWRGTSAAAARAAVETLVDQFGASPSNLVAALGPSIGPCCYEVGSELVDAFAAAGHPRHLVDRWFSIRRGRPSGPSASNGRLFLDVASANRDQLVLAGVREDNVFTCGLCTAEHLDVLTSYRAEKEAAGRLVAVIRASV